MALGHGRPIAHGADGFPEGRGPLPYGHGLHDVLAPNAPFTAAELFGEGAGGSAPLTNADVKPYCAARADSPRTALAFTRTISTSECEDQRSVSEAFVESN